LYFVIVLTIVAFMVFTMSFLELDQSRVEASRYTSGRTTPNNIITPFDAKHLGEKTYTNSLEQTFKRISPGKTIVNTTPNNVRGGKEQDRPEISLSQPFYIMTTEVTQQQWLDIMGSNPSQFTNCGPDCPVENVSWNEIQIFIDKLNKLEGTGKYRLPTSNEWQFAAMTCPTDYGPDDPSLKKRNPDSFSWYRHNSDNTTNPVGQKSPNHWGLYDMTGNVWEWVQDGRDNDRSSTTANSRTEPSSETGTRFTHGGGWFDNEQLCQATALSKWKANQRFDCLGFRLARSE
jgi:formylglycine-generating enzyme required for sulfatase activity